MTKAHLAIAVATALISIVTALPASAAVISCDSGRILDQNGRYVSRVQAFSAEITQELWRQGINASSVEDWNGCIRAYVTEGGHTSMQYFDPGTYERLQ